MRHFYLFLLLFAFTLAGTAQPTRFKKGGGSEEQKEEPKKKETKKPQPKEPGFTDRLVFGGNLGLAFGSDQTQILLAPQVGYIFNDQLIAGPGFLYSYLQIKQAYNPQSGQFESVNIENSVYGPTAFVNYFPFEQLFLGAQYELLNHDNVFYNPVSGQFSERNRWSNVLWLEAGYLQQFAGNGFVKIGLRANIFDSETSPYGNWWMPVIAIYF